MALGKIGPFDLDKDNWEMYVDRLEQYFIANAVQSELKVAMLITAIGNEAYELMVSLCTPAKPASKTYSELISLMKNHLNPKPSMLAERFKFRQRIQRNEESIAGYVTELKKLSKDCGFSADSLKENLRDQFVCGLVNDDIRQKLFTEDDITFDKAYKIAVAIEAAEANAALVHGDNNHQAGNQISVHRIERNERTSNRSGGRRRGGGSVSRGARGGGRCGGTAQATASASSAPRFDSQQAMINNMIQCKVCGGKHNADICKYKHYVCRVCNQEGHLKKMCPKLQGNGSAFVHNLAEDNLKLSSEDSGSDEVNNFSLETDRNQCKYLFPYKIDICINGTMISMEIDTGSAISCISLECYKKLLYECKMKNSDLILKYYTGEMVKPVGVITVNVSYKNKQKSLDLYIVKSGKTNLLGRCWISELAIDIKSVASCNKINNESFNLTEFSSRYGEVFSEGLGRFTGGTVGFRLREEARPVFLRARPLAYALREPVERALDQMVADGVISPVTTSDWATPIVPVMKKDGTIRVCADYKLTLNKCLEVDHYPLPRVEDLLTKLHGGHKFTKLDLSQAYAQFELDESKKFTVINTHKGLFMYNRLIYGLASSPGIFQRKLEQLFGDMPRVGVFLDDLIITGTNDESHLVTLHEVFKRLNKYGLKIKKEKCTFFADAVTYLGFVINKDGVQTCPKKIEAIKNAPVPTNLTELRSFIGLVMYYAKFVPNISTILAPLYNLLRKGVKFEWNESCMKAFSKIKRMLISSQILAHYSPELPLLLTTDASSVGVGAVISHVMPGGEERPIAYASRVLSTAEKSYSQIEREALAIIYGVRKFHQYLYGRKFILKTDHKPLITIFGNKKGIPIMAASRMQRWAVILAGYDYDIEYVRSDKNAADALSRLPVEEVKCKFNEVTYLNFIQDFLPVTRKTVQKYLTKDESLRKVFLCIQSGWPNECKDNDLKPYFARRDELYIDMGCIVWGYRLVIPSALRETILRELHVGHQGIVKMKGLARSIVWWPGIDSDIETSCRRCTTCALEGSTPPRAPPQPWPYHMEPWSRLHVDFLGPFSGKTFLVIIDSTSKWLEVFLMHRTTARATIKVLRETFARFGLPKEIVSDNGPPFSSREYEEFMKNNGIKITFSPVYHPSSNSAAENAVKLCKRAIKKSIRDGYDLETALQSYLMMYRNSEHCSTGTTPAQILQRRNLRSRLDLLKGERQVESKVMDAQRRQIHNAGGRVREFNVGENVWARDYTGEKWVSGKVGEKVGSREYVIGRDNGPQIKRHVDQIKKRRSSYGTTSDLYKTPIDSRDDSIAVPVVEESARKGDESQSIESYKKSDALGKEQSSPSKESQGTIASATVNEIPPSPSPVVLSRNRPQRIRKPVKRYGLEID